MEHNNSQLPRINFYLLSHNRSSDAFLFTCHLTEKAFRTGHKVYIQTKSEQQSAWLNKLLWTFNPESYIPHQLYTAQTSIANYPVIIGEKPPPAKTFSSLINICGQPSSFSTQVQRIFHIILNDDQPRSMGRIAYKSYIKHGVKPKMIKL